MVENVAMTFGLSLLVIFIIVMLLAIAKEFFGEFYPEILEQECIQ